MKTDSATFKAAIAALNDEFPIDNDEIRDREETEE